MKTRDYVKKVGGDYTFEGFVVAVFTKKSGIERVVVEDDRGILHIFNPKQLEVDVPLQRCTGAMA